MDFFDTVDVFSSVAFDTGYWPSAGDPITIRFFLTPTGGVDTQLYGTSQLAWSSASTPGPLPGELAHQVTADPGGWFGVTSEVAIGAEIGLDLFGIYSGVVPLVTEYITFDELVPVDGLLLAGGPGGTSAAVRIDDPNAIPPFAYAFSVVPGVDLVAAIQIRPDITAEISGVSVSSEVGTESLVQTLDDSWQPIPPDPTRPSELGMVTTWNGQLDAVLALVIEPAIEVDTFLGSFTLVSFPIPVSLVDVSERRASTPSFVIHPLPVLEDPDPGYDFGLVATGDVTNIEVPFDNLGALLLQGDLRIEGDASFSVWPDSLAALPDDGSGFVITYAPTAAGQHTANLVIASNDPTRPTVLVPLTGGAGGPGSDDPVPDVPDDEYDSGPTGFCGCANTAGGSSSGLALAVWLALGVGIRSRLPGGASRTSGSRPRR